jgi:hypothetical protein
MYAHPIAKELPDLANKGLVLLPLNLAWTDDLPALITCWKRFAKVFGQKKRCETASSSRSRKSHRRRSANTVQGWLTGNVNEQLRAFRKQVFVRRAQSNRGRVDDPQLLRLERQ